MSVKAVQDKIASGQSAAQLSGNISLNKFKQYLQKHGLNAVALKFLATQAGKAGSEELFAAALQYAAQNDPTQVETILNQIKNGPDNPAFLADVLAKVKDQDLTRTAYDMFKDKANYKQLLSKSFKGLKLGQVQNYYERIGAEDANHNGLIEASEAGYDPSIDLNQDKVVDLSEICVHLFNEAKTKDAHSFSQTIDPLRGSIEEAFNRSYGVSKQGEQYLNALNIVLEGNFPADVKLSAQWLKTDYLAKQAASSGDFQGALAIYETFAQDTGLQPGGLYSQLKTNESYLPFLQEYFAFYQDNGSSKYSGGTMSGNEFLNDALVTGQAFNLKNSTAKEFVKAHDLEPKHQQLFWKPSKKSNISITSSTELTPSDTFSFTTDQPPIGLEINGKRLSTFNYEQCYDLNSGNWKISMTGGDIYARASSADLLITAMINNKEVKIANLSLTHAEQLNTTKSAPVSAVQAEMISTLKNGGTLTSTMVIAPDSDDMVSWAAVALDGGYKGITTTSLAQAFLKNPKFVLDPNTPRGWKIVTELSAISKDAKKIQEYVDQNFTGQEKLRFFRMGDMFIGGGMGPYQHLEANGYFITNVEQTGEGNPCILRITAEKRIPISELSGKIKAAYDALPPEVQAQYQNNSLKNNKDGTLNLLAPDQSGIPVLMTIEIYSTTGDAVLATGSHLANKDSHIVGFQTHAPNSWGMDHEASIEAGNIPSVQSDKKVAYLPLHCNTESFKDPLVSQFGGDIWIGPGVGKDNSAVAHFNILMSTQEALITGHNTLAAAKKTYAKAGGPNQGAYVESQGSAIARFADSDNDQLPDMVDQTKGQSTVAYDPINDHYIADGNVVITSSNLLDGYFGGLDNISTELPSAAVQPETVVAEKPVLEAQPKQVAKTEGPKINATI